MRAKRNPIYTVDSDGKSIVRVPLANSAECAKLFRDDFDELMALGFTPNWNLNTATGGNSYVRCGYSPRPGMLVTVARLLMCPASRCRIRYRDGDRLNLRRDNLYVDTGGRRGGDYEARIVNQLEIATEYRSAA